MTAAVRTPSALPPELTLAGRRMDYIAVQNLPSGSLIEVPFDQLDGAALCKRFRHSLDVLRVVASTFPLRLAFALVSAQAVSLQRTTDTLHPEIATQVQVRSLPWRSWSLLSCTSCRTSSSRCHRVQLPLSHPEGSCHLEIFVL